ncbi:MULTISPECIES: hypothetical protein [Stenotrophomonas maltophilia group]|uniref:hypothetical protein n=1 Tax=Stenotrophomonas maltophilia group TaxID=995085 RepID=UPI000D40492C|nr:MULTISPECIES: hypothetical protein [Stenotrophomonas maltophilia group]MCF3497958.1 hypothetical protein [Stenotrophomonas maltophilia]MDQ4681678.1 hypothetical protein [Stenotrophomonas maltophilia group sp. RNC7]PSD20520.1 hypothetical protein C7E15_05170 [Stenotrophomonas maltophilia]QGL82628.1 hypothetical protein FEO94_18615 [Stenotrophomonas maltophilia]TIK67613.1 hypothetical protein E4418_11545 [Stenotrophomonas maltophilia]
MIAALLLAPAWVVAAPSPDCTQGLLQRLGWRFEEASLTAPQVRGGPVCTRASLADSQAAGDLQVRWPAALPAAARQALLQQLLDDPATVCAYAFELGAATRRATSALQGNPTFRFSGPQLGWIGFGLQGAPAQGWQRTRSFGRGFVPRAGNSHALQAFYSGAVRAECGVGRQVAQLATQRELYGDAAFDTGFAAEELSIGTFLALHDTDSILLGAHAGDLFADGKAVRTSAMGRQAFVGVPGFIEHVYDKGTLDDLSNQAENFVVVEVGEGAAQALALHAGLAWYDQRNAELWKLAQDIPRIGQRYFERLLFERDPQLRARLAPRYHAALVRMDQLLDDPFYQQFVIYVHPRGIRPIGYHIVRLLDRNPRTPFSIDLAVHNLHTTLYRRWREAQLRHCAATGRPGSLTLDPN